MYRSWIAGSTKNILFLNMLKFSKNTFLKDFFFLERKWSMFLNIWEYSIDEMEFLKLNNYWSEIWWTCYLVLLLLNSKNGDFLRCSTLHSSGEDWLVSSTTNYMFAVEKPLQITMTLFVFVKLIHRFQKYPERKEKKRPHHHSPHNQKWSFIVYRSSKVLFWKMEEEEICWNWSTTVSWSSALDCSEK